MREIRGLAVTAATLVLAAAACSSSGNAGSNPSGSAKHGGTITVAWVAASPNFIFPLAPATNSNGYNVNLTNPMWPNIVYPGDGGQSIVNQKKSLFRSLNYTNGDRTLTINLKPWTWSDGKPISSRDFTFVYNLLKADYANWFNYLPGQFPVDIASLSTPGPHTVVLNFTRPYNPNFFTDDVLSLVPLLPQHAWDKTAANAKVGNYDQTPQGAKAVYAFLQKQGGQLATFTTNPLWKVVDGPWTLSSFQSDGTYSYVPNKAYSGAKPFASEVVNQQFTSDAAELDALRAGSNITVAPLPLNDVQQEGVLKAAGYSFATQPIPGVANIYPNFYNAQAGPVLRQLYIRQALQDLINRPQIVQKVYNGYADPGNGPVPVLAYPPWVSPLEKSGGPYPYSPSAAISLLSSHGWKVNPGGVTTCQDPAKCGPGITAGQTLAFQLAYSSGSATFDDQEAAIQSTEQQAGVKFTLKAEPFNTLIGTIGQCTASSHPASTCGWQLFDEGYFPYSLYPAGSGFFNTGGNNNLGGYSDPRMDDLINATEYGSSTQSFFQYEDYTARQLPWLWLPQQELIQAYRSNLGGFAPLNPISGGLNPEDWYFTK